ncbi:putative transmembrane region and signal peptide protein [Rhodopirellula islandica]|uniref:Transmembrane region and signal peptide protein n=1 Tax=Rhodopirellula islandica TaxID=595434 RepID=A0A0J1BHK3_RHOIS|nr:hypothetical protein [Rhodopirellula islandica]KLU06011.1 putative transmembrane region and signal peptide protein [Rhodopirellula islandica]
MTHSTHSRHAAVAIAVTALTVLFAITITHADDGLFDNDGASTVAGDVLESRGDLAEGLGRGAVLRSLSAKRFQEAIAKQLENRKESVELYYDLKELREEQLEKDRLSASDRMKIANSQKPDRLNENQIKRETGEIFWPEPLDSPVLEPYRRPIEKTLAKRYQPETEYREFDFIKVHRMVKRMEEAVDSIKDELDIREVVALKDYLVQIDYEARFDSKNNRVDF